MQRAAQVAFSGDVEHEPFPVRSEDRIMLVYDLCYGTLDYVHVPPRLI